MRRIAGGLALAAALLALALFVAGSVPRNVGWREPDDGIAIMVASNGIHTTIVMPLIAEDHDWRTVFPEAALRLPDGRAATHVGIGFGERVVFLDTPEITDLSMREAARIGWGGGDGLVRVTRLTDPAPGAARKAMRITPRQYRRLAAAIIAELPPADLPRTGERGFEADAFYYPARARYTLGNTCNQWVGDRLSNAGIRTGWITPFAGSVMKWVRPGGAR